MTEAARPDHAELLDAVNAAGNWFHARKIRPIWAREVTEPTQVQTLEGIEDVPAGAFLCRGEAGDLWPQSAQRLHEKYQPTDIVEEGWRKYIPHPDNQGVMAAQIPHPFSVTTSWGVLQGQPGDYLLKNFEDRERSHPADVWIVAQQLFQSTYAAVNTTTLDATDKPPAS